MKLNKMLKDIEYTPKQVLAYYIVGFKNTKNYKNKKIEIYIKEIIKSIENINPKEIIDKININLISNFPFFYSINNEELLSYAIVVFNRLLSSNNTISEKDIVEELKNTMRLYSSRTIFLEADNVLNKIQKYK